MATRFLPAMAAGLLLNSMVLAQTNTAPPAKPSANADTPSKPNANATYYACKSADGSVLFSASPCSTDPSKMREIDTSAALRGGSGESQAAPTANTSGDDCHKVAYSAAYANMGTTADTSNQHIASYRERQQTLAAQKVYASDGSGNLIPDPAAQQQIRDLDGMIEREFNLLRQAKQSADTQYQAASKACDESSSARQQNPGKN